MSYEQYKIIPKDTSSIYYAFYELHNSKYNNKEKITKKDLKIIKEVFYDYDSELGLDHWKIKHNPHLRNINEKNIKFWINLYNLIIEKGIDNIN
jgi:hypothetical protein